MLNGFFRNVQLGGKRILASGGVAPWTEILTRNRILIRIPAEPLFHQDTHSSSQKEGIIRTKNDICNEANIIYAMKQKMIYVMKQT